MALYSDSKSGKVAFFQSKIAPWTTNAVAIGTTAGAVTDLDTKLTAAQDKMAAQTAAQQAAKTATEAADNAVDVLVAAGANIIADIRAKARNSADPASVYELAQIPAPATPTPVGTLGMPTDFSVELGANGAVTLKWKCASPRATGTTYQIYRRTTAEGEFTYLGGVGSKEYVDETIPTGSAQVTYQIQAVRSTAVGPWAQFNVNFGMTSSGAMTASVTESKPAKLAA